MSSGAAPSLIPPFQPASVEQLRRWARDASTNIRARLAANGRPIPLDLNEVWEELARLTAALLPTAEARAFHFSGLESLQHAATGSLHLHVLELLERLAPFIPPFRSWTEAAVFAARTPADQLHKARIAEETNPGRPRLPAVRAVDPVPPPTDDFPWAVLKNHVQSICSDAQQALGDAELVCTLIAIDSAPTRVRPDLHGVKRAVDRLSSHLDRATRLLNARSIQLADDERLPLSRDLRAGALLTAATMQPAGGVAGNSPVHAALHMAGMVRATALHLVSACRVNSELSSDAPEQLQILHAQLEAQRGRLRSHAMRAEIAQVRERAVQRIADLEARERPVAAPADHRPEVSTSSVASHLTEAPGGTANLARRPVDSAGGAFLPTNVRTWLTRHFLADPTPELMDDSSEPVVLVRYEDFADFLVTAGFELLPNLDVWKAAGWIDDLFVDLTPSDDPNDQPPCAVARLNLPAGSHRLVGIRRKVLDAPADLPAPTDTSGQASSPADSFHRVIPIGHESAEPRPATDPNSERGEFSGTASFNLTAVRAHITLMIAAVERNNYGEMNRVWFGPRQSDGSEAGGLYDALTPNDPGRTDHAIAASDLPDDLKLRLAELLHFGRTTPSDFQLRRVKALALLHACLEPAATSSGADPAAATASAAPLVGRDGAELAAPPDAGPGWAGLGDAKQAILQALQKAAGKRLDGKELASKSGYAHGTVRQHLGDLQRWRYIDRTKNGYALTPAGKALVADQI